MHSKLLPPVVETEKSRHIPEILLETPADRKCGERRVASSPRKFDRFMQGTLSSHDQVARALAADIINGVYKPGEKIPNEAEILQRFGVSRTVLREVLKTLTAKGLIVSKPRVGTKVLDPSYWNFFDAEVLSWKVATGFDQKFRSDLTEIRIAFEPRAASLAAERCTKADVAMLRECIGRMRSATTSSLEFAEADLEFHKAVINASGNLLLRSISGIIETALVASFRLSSPVEHEGLHDKVVARHEAIVDAIEVRDPQAAAEAMCAVIQEGSDRISVDVKRKRKKNT